MTIKNPQKFENNYLSRKKSFFSRIYNKLLHSYRRWFCQENYIFRHSGPFFKENRMDCAFVCYKSVEELPESIQTEIASDGVPNRLEWDKRELGENALLWIAMVDGYVASSVFTRLGKHFANWFLPLSPADVVVFRLRTHPNFRGREFAPSLMRHALYECTKEIKANGYIDCRTYNKSSIKCIKKAGFIQMAKKKTISRDWALHG